MILQLEYVSNFFFFLRVLGFIKWLAKFGFLMCLNIDN